MKGFVRGCAAALGLALGMLGVAGSGQARAADQPEITMAISQSPWLDAFVAMVDRYEQETGNLVRLDVSPFGGLLERIRNSVRGPSGDYDLVTINSLWLAEIYAGGFLAPLDAVRPGYRLQPGVLDYGGTTGWDDGLGSFSATGRLMGVPVNGNLQVLYYNQDVYDSLGLSVPRSWAELLANARRIRAETDLYGFVPRAARDSIVYNFTPWLFSHDGAFLHVTGPKKAEVVLNSPEGLAALESYLSLAAPDVAPPNPGAIAQGELIQLLAAGRAAQAVAVIAAWGTLEDPDQSRVVGRISAALLPAGPDGTIASSAGHWVAGIPANVAPDHQKAALAFLDWFQQPEVQAAYVEAGGVPVRGDLGKGRLADDRAYRFLDAYAQNAAHAVMGLPFAGAAEASDAMALHLNRAVIGEMTPRAALNAAAGDLAAILTRQGYQVTRLPDL